MATRICPNCGKTVPGTLTAALSDCLKCPNCGTRLEVATGSRMVPTFAGLVAGWLVWEATKNAGGPVGFVLPEFYSIVAFGAVSALLVMATARLQPALEVVAVPAGAPAGHGHH